MTPAEFRAKWTGHELKERSAAQEHFIDLCHLLNHPTPAEADPAGESFCFEKGGQTTEGGQGWADVWKRGFFGWEYKGPRADLDAAYRQLLQYREALENPPLLIVCDTNLIVIHTNFTNTVKETHAIRLDQIDTPRALDLLRKAFADPWALKPGQTPEYATEQAAKQIGAIAERLRNRGVPPHDAAHFLMKLIFCLFAEDVSLLPHDAMTRLLEASRNDAPYYATHDPVFFDDAIHELFSVMRTGGRLGVDRIDHFDGGLFDDDLTVRLDKDELRELARVARLDWSQVEPAVFGTLFERSLDPKKRAQLGAHYTSRPDIETIIEPVLMEPLHAEWQEVQERCAVLAEDSAVNGPAAGRGANPDAIRSEVLAFMDRLRHVRVLDPACGSGNFLYVALAKLKDLEKQVVLAAAEWGVEAALLDPKVNPAQLFGLEIDPYAAELARLTVWIGYLQWIRFNGFTQRERPILKPLDNIREQDAILGVTDEGRLVEPRWPETDVIVGNPPFLGGKRQRKELGDEYVERLFQLYEGLVPHEADLCCYWFEQARTEIAAGRAKRAGLLATNSIRQAQSRPVLQRILASGGIFWAISDREWVLDGAAVRTSMVGFDDGSQQERILNGRRVEVVNPDLSSHANIASARKLRGNSDLSFIGTQKNGAFDIAEEVAASMLVAPNPLGRSNADVVKPWANGRDLIAAHSHRWVIDFGVEMPEKDAALYEAPFEHLREHVRPFRAGNRRKAYRERWWIHAEPRPAMRQALSPLPRYIVTPTVAKHRIFVWVGKAVLPDKRLAVFARDDDYFLGILHSRVHQAWSLATCSSQGKGNDPVYTPETCFETFPFPIPSDAQRAAISAAAEELHRVRQSALDSDEKLTLTALYNRRPTWLDNVHRELDEAVLDAYGWPHDISDDELLERLLELNLQRAADEERGILVTP